jgi:hypothetical protein
MNVRSRITGKFYDPDNVWYVANMAQIVSYNENGAESEVLDVIYNGRMKKFIFVYPKNEFMKLLYDKWIEENEDGKETGK